MARATEHGEIWEARMDKLRPVVVVSRDDVAGRRQNVTVASVTTTVHDLASEVVVDHRDGLKVPSAVNCDELATITKDRLTRRIGRLSETRIEAIHDALRFALQLR